MKVINNQGVLMKKQSTVMLLSFFLIVAFGAADGHCTIYSYSGGLGGGGLVSSGNWQPATLNWSASTVAGSPGLWQYVYDLVLPNNAGKINQFIIEASLVSSITSTTGTATIGSHNTQAGLPNLTGIKLTGVGTPSSTSWHISFTTYNSPTWGDFYARGNSSNNVRNTGFAIPENDPLFAEGSKGNHILVPGAVVPIPAAAWLLGSGLLGLVAIRRRVSK
jgi:hypothetical protein